VKRNGWLTTLRSSNTFRTVQMIVLHAVKSFFFVKYTKMIVIIFEDRCNGACIRHDPVASSFHVIIMLGTGKRVRIEKCTNCAANPRLREPPS